jgi:hypothetical protein
MIFMLLRFSKLDLSLFSQPLCCIRSFSRYRQRCLGPPFRCLQTHYHPTWHVIGHGCQHERSVPVAGAASESPRLPPAHPLSSANAHRRRTPQLKQPPSRTNNGRHTVASIASPARHDPALRLEMGLEIPRGKSSQSSPRIPPPPLHPTVLTKPRPQ